MPREVVADSLLEFDEQVRPTRFRLTKSRSPKHRERDSVLTR
jgi:hypothetical protein